MPSTSAGSSSSDQTLKTWKSPKVIRRLPIRVPPRSIGGARSVRPVATCAVAPDHGADHRLVGLEFPALQGCEQRFVAEASLRSRVDDRLHSHASDACGNHQQPLVTNTRPDDGTASGRRLAGATHDDPVPDEIDVDARILQRVDAEDSVEPTKHGVGQDRESLLAEQQFAHAEFVDVHLRHDRRARDSVHDRLVGGLRPELLGNALRDGGAVRARIDDESERPVRTDVNPGDDATRAVQCRGRRVLWFVWRFRGRLWRRGGLLCRQRRHPRP